MTSALGAFARRERVTLNTLVQGAWSLLLQRYSGQRSVVFGATVSGRPTALADAEAGGRPVHQYLAGDRWRSGTGGGRLVARAAGLQPAMPASSSTPRWPTSSVGPGQSGQSLFDSLLVFENYPVDQRHAQRQRGAHRSFQHP